MSADNLVIGKLIIIKIIIIQIRALIGYIASSSGSRPPKSEKTLTPYKRINRRKREEGQVRWISHHRSYSALIQKFAGLPFQSLGCDQSAFILRILHLR